MMWACFAAGKAMDGLGFFQWETGEKKQFIWE
jgi:hypothetical protein